MRLRVEGLDLVRGQRVLARSLDLEVEPGQLWCVLGRNGTGKTTLLRTLAGLEPVSNGGIELNGVELTAWDWRELARERAFMAQKQRDAFRASVLETVVAGHFAQHGAGLFGSWFDDQSEADQALELLAALGLGEFGGRDVTTLSGGERQRVALACALMQDPSLLLLDEPLSHQDFDMQQGLLTLLRERLAARQRLAAVVLSVHDVNLVLRHASHVALFDGAGEVLCGPIDLVMNAQNLSRAYRHVLIECVDGGQRWFAAR